MRWLLRRLWARWKELAGYIGDFQARLLLTLFYFVVLMPFGLCVRWLGDPLRVRRREASSNWLSRETLDRDIASARRQF